jgi:hypothetical protein
MNIPMSVPLLVVALLAVAPSESQVAQTPVSPTVRESSLLPSQEALLEARVTALENKVTQMGSDIKILKNHAHQYLHSKGPTMYMSVHDLAAAMQPHSSTPTTQYFIPLTLSPSSQPGIGEIQTMTSGPITPP